MPSGWAGKLNRVLFDVRSIPLPAPPDYVGTWGSAVIAHPERPLVLVSLPRPTGPVALAVVHIDSGRVDVAEGLSGELRAGLVRGDEALVLTTHALCRVAIGPPPRIIETLRPKGMDTHLWRLLDVSDELVGVTGWNTRSIELVRRTDGELMGRVPLVSPHDCATVGDGVVRFLSFHGGEALDVVPATRRVRARHELPTGTTPVSHGDELYVLTGRRKKADRHVKIDEAWLIDPKLLSVLDADTLAVRRSANAPKKARDVVAVTDDEVVVTTEAGIAVIDRATLRERGRLDKSDRAVWWHAWVPSANAVVMLEDRFVPQDLTVVRWSRG